MVRSVVVVMLLPSFCWIPRPSAGQARKDGRTGRAGAHSASATLTSFTTASRPGNTLTGHWSVPSAGGARTNDAVASALGDVNAGLSGRGDRPPPSRVAQSQADLVAPVTWP